MIRKLMSMKAVVAGFAIAMYSQVASADEPKSPVVFPERAKLVTLISEAKKKGVGTKPYEDALAAVDLDLGIAEKMEIAKTRLQSLTLNLQGQLGAINNLKSGRSTSFILTSEERNQWGAAANYMKAIQSRIKRCWYPPKAVETKRVVVIFKILSSGEVSELRVDNSSGFPTADAAALDAVQKAQDESGDEK